MSTTANTSTDERQPPAHPFPIVGIGASAGGLTALKQFFDRVPPDSGVAFVVVVHLSPEHESHLAALLAPHCQMPVHTVDATVALERDHVYVIPPGANLDAIDSHLRLSELERHRLERAPIDHFFRTLAAAHDGYSIGVVLTGTGSDGTLGLREIKARGGLTVAQDPTDAEYDGMPRSAIASAPVDLVLPLADIPEAVLAFARTRPNIIVPGDGDVLGGDTRLLLASVLAPVRARTGWDFSQYKPSTLLRRIRRRMQFHHVQEPGEYVHLLERQGAEVAALADDLLITVTSFFRDPDVFEVLARTVVPALFLGRAPGDPIRAWSVGCATGEEPYSLAMLLLDEASRQGSSNPLQVFASDLHKRSLERAREGFYPGDIEADVPAERLERFFDKEPGGYRVRKEVRNLVVFTPHNLLGDPPFSRLDLVTCRNVLIYLQRELQQQVAELFHYALEPDGWLVLGTSEGIDAADLFRVEDKRHSIYRKRNVRAPEPRLPVFPITRSRTIERPDAHAVSRGTLEYGALHQQLVESQAPPSVLVSPDDRIVHYSPRAGRYLVHPAGAPTTSVYKLVREELRVELRLVLPAARSQRTLAWSEPVSVRWNGDGSLVSLRAQPAVEPAHEGFVLVLFEEVIAPLQPTAPAPASQEADVPDRATARALELERARAHEKVQAIIKDYETGQEELRASNEELQSANEELRSTMEELETSKEELQSMNEELQTVNQENRHKVEELDRLSRDLQHLFEATDIATLFLDRELRILRFTPSVASLFNVQITDHGRPLADFTHSLQYPSLREDAERVLKRLAPIEREIRDRSGRWYLGRILPYRTAADRIGGVVITFIDITDRKGVEDAMRAARDYAEQIIESLPQPLLVLTPDLRVRSANPAYYRHFGSRADETEGRRIFELGDGQWNIPALRSLLEEVLPQDKSFRSYEVEHEFPGLGRRVMLLNGRRLDSVDLILLGIADITDSHEAAKKIRQSEARLRSMLEVEGVGVLIYDAAGTIVEANDAFLALTGRTREEVSAHTLSWRDLTPAEHVESTVEQLRKLEAAGRLGPYEKEYLHRSGARPWVLLAGASLGDGTFVEYCIDVSDRKRAERALAESEARFRMLAELSPDAIFVERDGLCDYANPAAADLLRAGDPREIFGRSLVELLEPEARDAWRARSRHVLEAGRPAERVEARWRRLDGSEVDVEVVAGPIELEGAGAVEIVARDVTERNRAQELLRSTQEQRYRTLFESIDQGFCVIEVLFDDAGEAVDYRFLEVNPAFVAQTGIENAVGRRMREIAPAHEAHWFQIYGQVARTGEPVRFEGAATALGRFYEVYAFRVGDPSQARVAVLFHDIGERRRLQDELRRAADELSEASRRKDDYLAMLGHELRNPLAAIRSATELVRLTEVDDARLRRARAVLERQTSHMARLIDGLLEVSRIARGKMDLHFSALELRGILTAVVQDRMPEVATRGLELETLLGEVDVWVAGDDLRLVQVFDNLVGNAVKFTPPPGKITVSLTRDEERAFVSIQDTGIGIRPPMLARIFEAFQQETQDIARSAGGLGLGLSLAKGLVDLHRGTIHAKSDGVGRGAELVVCLPLTSPPPPQPMRPPPRRHRPRRVLLVEDNADAAEMLADLLRASGHDVQIASAGDTGLRLLARGGVDIVLCDLGLPGMSGLDFARAVRRDDALCGVPLVALTGYGQVEDRAQSSEAGFDAHLVKPVDLEMLDDVIARLAAPRT